MVVAARNEEKLQALAAEIGAAGGQAQPLVLDVTRPETFAETLKTLPEAFAAIDVLVNNAGVTADNLLARMSLEDWERVLRTNLTGAFALTKEVIRGMMKRRWGRIINVSSVVGMMGNAGQANYAASKAGLIGFSKSLARELGSRSITVNVVAPGYIQTAMTENLPEASREELHRLDRAQAAGHGGGHRLGGALPGERRGGVRHRPHAQRIGRAVYLEEFDGLWADLYVRTPGRVRAEPANPRMVKEGRSMAVAERVKSIIVEQLGVDEEEVTLEASFTDDLGADSLDIVELVMAFEEEFGIEIPDEEAEKISNVRQAVDYIQNNAGDQN